MSMKTFLWSVCPVFLALCALFGLTTSAYAEIAVCVSEDGVEHYYDAESKRPAGCTPRETGLTRGTLSKSRAPHYPTIQLQTQPAKGHGRIEIFVTAWCGYCKALERYLKERRLRYTRYDIETDRRGREIYEKLGGQGVPLIKVGNQTLQGFNQSKLESLLAP